MQQGGPWDETDRIVPAAVHAVERLHRPSARGRAAHRAEDPALRPRMGAADSAVDSRGGRGRRAVPRAGRDGPGHPRRRPIPRCCSRPCSHPEQLDELAFDPRAYDFDHPVNKRPNYLFGQWDMHQLDNAGRCRRFVLQQVTLDAMLDRVEHRGRLPHERGAVRGGGRAGRHDADGLGRQRQPARRPRFDRHAGHAGAEDRRLSRRLLRAAARAAERPARPSGCGPRPRRCGSRSAARGSTSTSIWPGAGPSSCSTCTWRSCSRRMGYTEAAARQVARRAGAPRPG